MIPRQKRLEPVDLRQTAVRLDRDTHRELEKIMRDENVRMSDVMRHLIRLGLERYKAK